MFRADPKMVKEQIEVLIRDEYMKRDDNDKALLIYLPWTRAKANKVCKEKKCKDHILIREEKR